MGHGGGLAGGASHLNTRRYEEPSGGDRRLSVPSGTVVADADQHAHAHDVLVLMIAVPVRGSSWRHGVGDECRCCVDRRCGKPE